MADPFATGYEDFSDAKLAEQAPSPQVHREQLRRTMSKFDIRNPVQFQAQPPPQQATEPKQPLGFAKGFMRALEESPVELLL